MLSDPERWPFTGYEKIADSLEGWLGDDEAAYRALRGAVWVVSEKIHGANFCLVTDGAVVRPAKRKAFLGPGEDFFGHEELLDRIAPRVLALASDLRAGDAAVELVNVHCELFGGGYPHPEVPAVEGVAPVQTGCWYCPGIEVCVLDVAVLAAGERRYLDFDEVAALSEAAGLLYARALFRGPYEEAIAHPLGFESTLPALLGLPALPGNKAEGVVVKPASAVRVPRRAGWVRPVIKRKIAEFAEDERFHGAEKWAAPRQAGAGALEVLRYEVSCLVNEARLAAAVSKVGRVAPGDRARAREVMMLVVDDLTSELSAKHGAQVRGLRGEEAAALRAYVEGEARALVEVFLGVSPE
jgi:Rnl2 family RNA ligase